MGAQWRNKKIMKTLDLCAIVKNGCASDRIAFQNKIMKTMDLEGQIPPCYMGVYASRFLSNRANFKGSPCAKEAIKTKDLTDTRRWRRRRRRGLLIRPYLHARIPRITVMKQFPQMKMKMMMMMMVMLMMVLMMMFMMA